MECGQEYTFTEPDQFWAELDDLLSISPASPLDTLDYALRNYIAFLSTFMDEFLAAPGALDHALLMLLESPLFTSHRDRMTFNIIQSIASPSASSSTLFVSLMLVLHLGEGDNPLTTAIPGTSGGGGSGRTKESRSAGITVGSSKVFRVMRKLWGQVVPVLMKWVRDAGVVEDHQPHPHLHHLEPGPDAEDVAKNPNPVKLKDMPEEGWEERVGTAATAVLYEVCRVQKLSPEELAYFTFDFISHLFLLVERTRDAEDETFNYSLIKLICASNEQYMVSSLPVDAPDGQAFLPPPILPNVVTTSKDANGMGQVVKKKERGPNFVLEVLKEQGDICKTFGENIIFILNRADGTPDSLCVSLLILKVLYLLFTTSGTQEFFYTNDLCVLIDVFIRELHDLGEESEGLKHTYLRVLHPLMTNTQLRHHPYKRPELRKILEQLVRPSLYREVDPTTRRLVERNLRGSWCAGLRAQEDRLIREDQRMNGSTLSVDAVAVAEEGGTGGERGVKKTRRPAPGRPAKGGGISNRRRSLDDSTYGNSPTIDSITTFSTTEGGGFEGKRSLVDQVAKTSLDGTPPDLVKTSYYDYRPHDDDLRREDTIHHSPVEESFPSNDVVSIATGHEILNPIAERHNLRSTSASHPPLESFAPAIISPRPRSTSLSANSTTFHSKGFFQPPEDAPPLPPASPLSSSCELMGSSTSRRRRAPPPPTNDSTTNSASSSRPRTPIVFAANLPGDLVDDQGSPRIGTTTARRRPPPPPGSPRTSSV